MLHFITSYTQLAAGGQVVREKWRDHTRGLGELSSRTQLTEAGTHTCAPEAPRAAGRAAHMGQWKVNDSTGLATAPTYHATLHVPVRPHPHVTYTRT